MNFKNTFKLVVLFITLSLISCKEFQEISVSSVDDFKISNISSEKIEAEINVKIKNPNSIGFSIYPSEFNLVFSGINLGKAKLNKRVHINANTEKSYSFKLNTKIKDLNPLDLMQLLNSKKLGKIEVNGNLKAGKFYLKKKYPINYVDKVNLFK
jgi:LEA14-like dessication related protein